MKIHEENGVMNLNTHTQKFNALMEELRNANDSNKNEAVEKQVVDEYNNEREGDGIWAI